MIMFLTLALQEAVSYFTRDILRLTSNVVTGYVPAASLLRLLHDIMYWRGIVR